MKATELLKHDHDTVEKLFGQYEQAEPGSREAKEIADTIFVELTAHTQVEEELFYPAVQDSNPDLAGFVVEAIEEHQAVDEMIDELMEMDTDDDQYGVKMKELFSNVRHHVQEEENELFPKVESSMGNKLESIGREMSSRKQDIQKAA